jgi:putative endonuclease
LRGNAGLVRSTWIDGPIVKHPCIYILASKRNGTLYVGLTSDVLRRTWAHKSSAADGFTKNYRVHLPVHAEFHDDEIQR